MKPEPPDYKSSALPLGHACLPKSYVIMLGVRLPETENKRICQTSGLTTGHGREKYSTEKQNGYFQSSHLREVVAYEKWSL